MSAANTSLKFSLSDALAGHRGSCIHYLVLDRVVVFINTNTTIIPCRGGS